MDLSAIESIDGRKPNVSSPVVNVKSRTILTSQYVVKNVRNTVDVRGLRVHEAEVVVEEYLRTATGPTWVIHGIGTGKLKKGLRKQQNY